MICPNCGLNFDQPDSSACPRCGYALAGIGTAAESPAQQGLGSQQPGSPYGTPASVPLDALPPPFGAASPSPRPSQPSAPPASAPPASAWGATSGGPSQNAGYASASPGASPEGYGWFAPASGSLLPPSAQQQAPAGLGQHGQSGAPALPPYGQPAAVSSPLYGQQATSGGPLFGQAAAASGPVYGQPIYGQQPGQDISLYGQPAPAAENEPSTWILPATAVPAAPTRKTSRRRGRAILIAALAVVVVLALAGGGLVVLSSRSNSAVLFSDPLTTDTGHWPTNSSCTFQPDGYHIVDGYICYADSGTYGNVTISVQSRQVTGSGADAYSGIALRRVSAGNLYTFGITSSGQWMFVKTVDDAATAVSGPQSSAAINRGLGAANTLEVRASGSHFDLFVNGTQVGSANDTTFKSGLCGLFVDQSIESAFTQFQVTR